MPISLVNLLSEQTMVLLILLKDMTLPGSKVIADGKVIYEEGQWKI